MKLLHTSDWHLGQNFMSKSRLEEHEAFLGWLFEIIKDKKIDTIIVAGDIFDTSTPPNYALELYYNFLTKLCASGCKNIIIIAGNHDSIATLKAPKQLLKALNVHVITSGDESEDEIVKIYDKEKLEAIVCAVPFLRDYVVRESLSGESIEDKEDALSFGIKKHYQKLYKEALTLKKEQNIPIIATGHLTTLGSKNSSSERDIYIGNTLNIDSGFLSDMFDYTALGHLHINQRVGCDSVRYSGSPIPLGFSEASSQKKVNIVEFKDKKIDVEELNIPIFRKLLVCKGDMDEILDAFEKITDKSGWIEVHLDDKNPFHANQVIRQRAKELGLSVLAIKSNLKVDSLKDGEFNNSTLDELSPLDVFKKRLQQEGMDDKDFEESLVSLFKEVQKEVLDR